MSLPSVRQRDAARADSRRYILCEGLKSVLETTELTWEREWWTPSRMSCVLPRSTQCPWVACVLRHEEGCEHAAAQAEAEQITLREDELLQEAFGMGEERLGLIYRKPCEGRGDSDADYMAATSLPASRQEPGGAAWIRDNTREGTRMICSGSCKIQVRGQMEANRGHDGASCAGQRARRRVV